MPDRWSRWLLERRDGGDARRRETMLAHLGGIRDRVLERAEPLEGATLLDVGAGDRARFISANAADLEPIPSESVDVVTTRSVLIYVLDKRAAFEAMHRVLRPGGRISLFEPINRLMYPEPAGRFYGYEVGAVADLAAKVKTALVALPEGATSAAR